MASFLAHVGLKYPIDSWGDYDKCVYLQVWRDNGGWNVIATVGGHSHRVSMASIQPGKEEKMVTSSLDR